MLKVATEVAAAGFSGICVGIGFSWAHLFVRIISYNLDLSSLGDPTGSNVTIGLAITVTYHLPLEIYSRDILRNIYVRLPAVNTWCVQVLRSPKEAFAAAMQSWRERCEKCVCLQGDYVEK